MWRLTKRFLSMPAQKRNLFLEALFYLAWARILKALPFSRVAPSLGTRMEETTYLTDKANEALLLQISRAVHAVSRHTWWESRCLVKAIAVMKMLERRKIDSTLYLGTGKNEAGKMTAHAWLRSGRLYLTGADVMKEYTVVAIFGKSLGSKETQRSF